jgi:hypothetical protein
MAETQLSCPAREKSQSVAVRPPCGVCRDQRVTPDQLTGEIPPVPRGLAAG